MGLKVLTPVATEVVSLADAKVHLRVDHSSDDDLITALISAAREECEHLLERSIGQQTLSLSLDAFPADGIELPRPPVTSIVSIEYVDADGVTQALAGASYYLDDEQEPSWVVPAYGVDWPDTRNEANAVVVTYVAGYTTCPNAIRAWMLLRIGTLYRTREADSDRPALPSPFADRLLDRYRIWGV